VGVIGAGRVGAVLGAALQRAGHPVVAVSAVSDASLARAAALLPDVPVRPLDEVARSADLVLLAVPDDALAGLVSGLAHSLRPGQLVAHTSGRHGLAVLAPAAAVGAVPLALHPVLPFTGTAADLDRLAAASWGITATSYDVAEQLVRSLGGSPVRVAEELRPLWHAALAHGANHLVALVASVADLLRSAGADDPGAVLRPLLTAALDGALEQGDAALTGPVSRGDAGTVAAHLQALPDAARPAYAALARLTTDRALVSGRIDDQQAADLRAALAPVEALS
jgi:predicted short-subunit dehydrogenase-like oxidoreductase (DUF2520 family)